MNKKELDENSKKNHCDGLFVTCQDDNTDVKKLNESVEKEESYSEFLETQCGATDDSQAVEFYDGTLGVTKAFVNARESSVGQLQWNDDLGEKYNNPGNVNNVRWCSGTLISKDLFLTAGHCFDQTGNGWSRPKDNISNSTIPPSEIATNMHVNFNYQMDTNGNLRQESKFPVLEILEYRLGGLDFAIVKLGGNPGSTFGTTKISKTDASIGSMLCIIGHPAGVPKRLEAGPTTDLHGISIGYNDIDTLGGNSGSGVLSASSGKIVGVHTNGGCRRNDPNNDSNHNHGVRITSIIANSPEIKKILNRKPRTLAVQDNIRTLPSRDNGTIPSRDTLARGGDRGTFVLRDNSTFVFRDKGTIPSRDTLPTGGDRGTLAYIDNRTQPIRGDFSIPDKTFPYGNDVIPRESFSSYDRVKASGLDKQFSDNNTFDRLPDRGRPFRTPQINRSFEAQPFILATPHHTNNWESLEEEYFGDESMQEFENEYEEALVQLQELMEIKAQELEELEEEYEQIASEYENYLSESE